MLNRLAIACLLATAIFGQTTVHSTVGHPLVDGAGNLANGTIYVTPSVQFTTTGGIVVYPITTQVRVANGIFSVALYPNDATSNPLTGTSYLARYSFTGGGSLPNETWVVPTSGSPVELITVRTAPTPAPTYLISLSQLSTSGCTNGQIPAFNGSAFACSSSGTGTVTHTAGALTGNQLIFGNGTGDIKASDLTGMVTTSGGTATTIASGVVTNAMLAGSIAASKLIGTDIATLGTVATGTWHGTAIDLASYASGILPCADHPALTGDVTTSAGSCATTTVKINGVALSGLATGILRNTTATGVPSIAVAGDFPTLNQNTSGSAATLSGSIVLGNTPLTTRGDLLTVNSTPGLTRLAKGTQYQTLQGGSADLGWDALHLDQASAITGVLPNANTTAASTNTASTIVLRDGSGNFSAGTITGTNLTSAGQLTGASFFCNGVSTKTSNYTVTGADCTILVDTTGGNVGITLPATPSLGQIVNIKKIAAGNTLTILGNGHNIDGAASVAVTTNNVNTKVQYDTATTAWYTL